MAFLTQIQFSNSTLISLIPLLVASLGIAVLNGILLMVDAAFASIPEDQVNHLAETDPVFAKLQKFLKKREKIITSILFLAEVIPIVGGSQLQKIQHSITLNSTQEIVVEVVSILLIIQVAAILKSFGYKYSKEVAINSVLALKIISSLISPISTLIEKVAHTIVGDLDRERYIVEAVLRGDLQEAEEREIIDRIEHGFIENAFQFSENTVSSVMTFMDKVFAIHSDKEYSVDELIHMFDQAHSRVPIVGCNNLKIECSGYVLTKELLLGILSVAKDLPERFTFDQLVDCVEKSKYKNRINVYPGSTIEEHESISKVWKLFTTKQISEKATNNSSLAVVTHPRSGLLLGIVTLTDLLQELVGNPLYDEDDHEPVKQINLLSPATD